MLPKTSAYVISYDAEIKWMNFFIKDRNLLTNKKSVMVLKNNLIVNLL